MGHVDQIAALHQNFIGSYRLLAKHVEGSATYEGHGVFAFATGVPTSVFNGCIALDDASEEAFGSAVGWLLRRELPCRVWVHEPAATRLGGVASAFGLARLEHLYPGMALQPIPEPPPTPAGVTIDLVNEENEADLAIYAELWLGEAAVRKLFGRSFRTDPNVRMFVARLDDESVGTSLAIRTGDVAGVYSVGTVKSARKRGVGTAATWAAIGAARDWGCDIVVLQSSSMGLSIYRAMGFEVVASYATFVPPESA